MRKSTIVFILLLPILLCSDIISESAFGGEFNDTGRKILLNDDEILTVGYTFSSGAGKADIYLTSTDIWGNLNWEGTYGGAGWDYGLDICRSVENDGYILAGYTTSWGNGSMDFLMIKVDLQGNEIWLQTFGGNASDIATAICYSSEGGYFICGYTESFGAGVDDVYLIKTSSTGEEIWSQTYGSTKSETAHDIAQTSDGNLIIAGSTGVFDIPGGAGRNRDMYFLKTDEEGNVLAENEVWIITSQQGSYDMCYSILESPEGGFYALGNSSCEGAEVMDVSLLKLDEQLNEEWKNSYELATIYDFGYSVGGFTADNCIYITGTYKFIDFTGNKIYFKKLDLQGNEIVSETFDLDEPASAYDVAETSEGDFLIIGHITAQDGSYDLMQLHISGMEVEFSSSQETGHSPLEVTFQDQTFGYPVSWAWDFDNDGQIDSQDQNPSFNFSEPGIYTVSLEVSDLYFTKSIIKENYVRVFDGESALQFDGSESYVSVPAAEPIDLTGALTLEAWIYPVSWGETSSFGGRILDKSSYGIYLCEAHSSLNNHCLGLQLKTEEAPLSFSASEENSILLNNWQHVAVTYDGIDEVAIYINGEASEVTQLNPPAGALLQNTATDLIIGKSSNLSWAFDGIIDDVRIWNIVRTETEIQQNLGACLTGNETGLVAYWDLNDAWGTEIVDETGNNSNGSIIEALWMQGTPFEFTGTDDEEILDICDISNLRNYPNPFNPSTTISFSLTTENTENTELTIYNLKGQKVKDLTSSVTLSGVEGSSYQYSARWNGFDNDGKPVPSGIYFYKISTNGSSRNRKMLLLK
jgi:PKD repeat protein